MLPSEETYGMRTSITTSNPFQPDEDSGETIESDCKKTKTSNNRGAATRINMPYIPHVFRGLPVSRNRVEPTENPGVIESPTVPILPDAASKFVTMKAEKHICYVCRRKFRDYDHLSRHERISFLHKKNSESKIS